MVGVNQGNEQTRQANDCQRNRPVGLGQVAKKDQPNEHEPGEESTVEIHPYQHGGYQPKKETGGG